MKITKTELKQIIKEEAERYTKLRNLEARKKQLTSQLNEMYKETEEIDESSDYDDEKYGKKPGEPKGHTEDGEAGRGRPEGQGRGEDVDENIAENLDEPIEGKSVAQNKDAFANDGMDKDSHINESAIRKIFREEAERAQQSKMLKEEAIKILSEMADMGVDIEEGILGKVAQKVGLKDSPEEINKRKEKIQGMVEKAKAKGYKNFSYDGESVNEEKFYKKMEQNGYTGRIVPVAKKATIVYKPGKYGAGRLGSGGSSQGLGV